MSGGKFDLRVTIHGIPVYMSEKELCSVAPCPLAAGPVLLQAVQELPEITPAVRTGGEVGGHPRPCPLD